MRRRERCVGFNGGVSWSVMVESCGTCVWVGINAVSALYNRNSDNLTLVYNTP